MKDTSSSPSAVELLQSPLSRSSAEVMMNSGPMHLGYKAYQSVNQ